MDKLQAIKVFIEVAKRQSFSEAAGGLGLSAPAVTRAIAFLEHDLQVKLFNRTTRLVRLTESGSRFFHDTERILEDLEEAESAAAGEYTNLTGTLMVTAPLMFGQKHVMPIVSEYLKLNAEVTVKAMFFDKLTNLMAEQMDVAIRIGHMKDSNLYATQVGQVRRVVCGSPEYFKKMGKPKQPSDLVNHDVIFPINFDNAPVWSFQRKQKKEYVKLTPLLQCNQNAVALDSAVIGNGITRLMSYQIGNELKQGQLISVLTNYEEEPLPVNVIHLEGRRANAKTRSFVDLAIKRLRENPIINP